VFSASFNYGTTRCTLRLRRALVLVKSPAKGFPTKIAKIMQHCGQNSCGAWTKWLWLSTWEEISVASFVALQRKSRNLLQPAPHDISVSGFDFPKCSIC